MLEVGMLKELFPLRFVPLERNEYTHETKCIMHELPRSKTDGKYQTI